MCASRQSFGSPRRMKGLATSLMTRPSFCHTCFGHLDEQSKNLVIDGMESLCEDVVLDDGDEQIDDGSCEASEGKTSCFASHVAGARRPLPGTSSASEPPPPMPPSSFIRRRRRGSQSFAKGRLKLCATGIPQECRGDGAPTVMDNEGWMAITAADTTAAHGCSVTKELQSRARRRMTGGMQTFLLQCGILVEFFELYKGESLQLVYAKLLMLDMSLAVGQVTQSLRIVPNHFFMRHRNCSRVVTQECSSSRSTTEQKVLQHIS